MQATPFRLAILLLATVSAASARAQQLIGYVNPHDAVVTGASDTVDDRAVLTGSVSVTARDHTANIALARGGTVSVCQTSVLHVTESRAVSIAAPLLFALDSGAIEMRMNAASSDAIMTPDLRFTVRSPGPLDLRMRVSRNGDTCVENRGPGAPTLAVSDPFGESMYELAAGQHVLFEHGSLREVVDRETIPCGCPDGKGMSLADALIGPSPAANPGAKPGVKTASPPPPALSDAPAAATHPFPAALSEGLAPAEPAPPVSPLENPPPQVSEALAYNGATKDPDALPPQDQLPAAAPANKANKSPSPAPPAPIKQTVIAASAPVALPAPAAAANAAAPAHPAPPPDDFVHVVGRFFRKLFGRH